MQKGIIKKVLIVLLPLAALMILALFDPSIAEIGTVLQQISPFWFVFAAGSMLLYYYFDVLMYQLACKYMQIPQKFGGSVITTMVGFFYSALTPFSSGGQPMQVLQMRRRGIKVGAATSVLMLKFMAWQLAISLLGVFGFIFCFGDMRNRVSMIVMYIIGFIMYIGTLLLALLAFLKPDFVFRTGERLINFLERHHFLKKEEHVTGLHATWARTISDFSDAIKFSFQNKTGMLLIFLVAVMEAFSYMAVTYFIYRGLGFSAASLAYVVLLQGFLYISVSFIPLPGASIASEGGFYVVFSALFPPAARFPALLTWRLLTYYSSLILGLIAIVVDGVRNPNPNTPPKSKINSAFTAIGQDMQQATYTRSSTLYDPQPSGEPRPEE